MKEHEKWIYDLVEPVIWENYAPPSKVRCLLLIAMVKLAHRRART